MEREDIQVSRIRKVDGEAKLKAFADVTIGGLLVKGFKVVEGAHGLFVGMPSQQGKDGRWYQTVHPASAEFKAMLNDVVLTAYKTEKDE